MPPRLQRSPAEARRRSRAQCARASDPPRCLAVRREEPADRFIGRESFRGLYGRGRGDRTSKHAIHVGNWDDDPITDFVLQIEDSLRLPDTIERLGPKVRSRVGIHQLHSDT